MTKSLTLMLLSFVLGCTTAETDSTRGPTAAGGKGDTGFGWCDDGQPAFCALAEPSCPHGTVSALIDGCWTCANADTCEPLGLPRDCNEGVVFCTIPEPHCPAGTVAAAQNGCWTCANPFTCESSDLPRNCDDGQPAVCALPKPVCELGKVAAAQDGCWACVDPVTCH